MSAEVFGRVELPNGQGAVLLYDWMSADFRDGRNLVRVGPDGTEVWRAKPIFNLEDCFTTIKWDGAKLTANTMSCYLVEIDQRDGTVTALTFTK
jgi:hypothetical protein